MARAKAEQHAVIKKAKGSTGNVTLRDRLDKRGRLTG
jgi:hypothetical protein